MSALQEIISALRDKRCALSTPYYVPGLWIDYQRSAPQAVNPYDFYAEKIQSILDRGSLPLPQGSGGGDWTRFSIVYNLFPRLTAAYDHTHDGTLEIGPTLEGWRDTGTLLKCIALLPYIQNMGINTIHLLPINSIGVDGKKGTLGSPYSIRNPYELDHNLEEPALGLDASTLFAGFVEGAHHLGMRVVMEFVLRISAKDSDWIGDHPDWFYWIRANVQDRRPGSSDSHAFGSPIFPGGDLSKIREKVHRMDLTDLPAPPAEYQQMFTQPPRADQVHMENGQWIGVLDDGTRVRIPGAFSDYPPDDNQPPWTDVTYLRLYDHPDFNYTAYNTLRMYDARFDRPENAVSDLWNTIIGVIPYYQQRFGIDGVMIDMGHALPATLKQRIVSTARSVNPDFAFWDENFSIGYKSVDEGYNAVLGYLVFDFNQPGKLREFLDRLAHERLPLPFFVTPETHNTPRAFSRPFPLEYVHYALAMSILIPGIPVIHSGFELMETKPVNTGLGFTNEMIYQHAANTLPLFSEWSFDWTRPDNLVGSVRYAMQIRSQCAELFSDPDPATFFLGWSDNPNIVTLARQNEGCTVILIASTSMGTVENGRAYLPVTDFSLAPTWGTDVAHIASETISVPVTLGNGHVLIFDDAQKKMPRLRK